MREQETELTRISPCRGPITATASAVGPALSKLTALSEATALALEVSVPPLHLISN
jgi:hypothetical protein